MRSRAPTVLDLGLYALVPLTLVLLILEVYFRLDHLIPVTLVVPAFSAAMALLARLVRLAWWKFTGETALVNRVYEHVDDVLGAGDYEARRSSEIKRWMDLFTGNIKGFVRPVHYRGGIQLTRKRRYVRLEMRRRWGRRRFTRRDIAIIWLRWTSEVNVHIENWTKHLERKVAQSLGRKHHDGMFQLHEDEDLTYHDTIGFQVKELVAVPDSVHAEEDLDDDDLLS